MSEKLDFTQFSENEEVVALLKQLRELEIKICELDDKALVKYALGIIEMTSNDVMEN